MCGRHWAGLAFIHLSYFLVLSTVSAIHNSVLFCGINRELIVKEGLMCVFQTKQ